MKRLILTYNQACNLKCKFCYVDFHHKKIVDKTLDIVRVAIENKFDVITFGGGDSFSKNGFREACILAKENRIFTHVDTNAIAIRSADFEFINNYVDLIGISMDAIGNRYSEFRDSKDLFEKVTKVLERLNEETNTPIKINTIVTKSNADCIIDIKNYISKFKKIKRWSLYQYFPLSAAKKYRHLYEIDENEYDLIIDKLNISDLDISVDCFKYKDRVNGYLFCDEEGQIYTNNISGEYQKLFTIFDKDLKIKLAEIENKINPRTIVRYI